MKHGAPQRYCELHGWVPERHWGNHTVCEMTFEAGSVLVNPRGSQDVKLDGVRLLAIVEDSDSNEVFVLQKVFSSPAHEKAAGHHKYQAMTRRNFASRYGAWSER